jgi:hypothetical protein
MQRLIDGIRQFALDFSKNAFYRSLAYGMIFSILFTLLIGGIEGVFNFNSSFPYIQVIKQAYWVGIVFVSFSFLFAFFGYVSDLRTRDDVLVKDDVVKAMEGRWYDIDNSMYNLARRIPDLKGFGEHKCRCSKWCGDLQRGSPIRKDTRAAK